MSEARHRAAERWLSAAIQRRLAKFVGKPVDPLTMARLVKAITSELQEAEPWLDELLPENMIRRRLQVFTKALVFAPIDRVTFNFVVEDDDDDGKR